MHNVNMVEEGDAFGMRSERRGLPNSSEHSYIWLEDTEFWLFYYKEQVQTATSGLYSVTTPTRWSAGPHHQYDIF